jgi:hypothetical protein
MPIQAKIYMTKKQNSSKLFLPRKLWILKSAFVGCKLFYGFQPQFTTIKAIILSGNIF